MKQELVIEGYANPMIQLKGIRFVPPQRYETKAKEVLLEIIFQMKDFEKAMEEYIRMNRREYPNLNLLNEKRRAWNMGINVAEFMRMR